MFCELVLVFAESADELPLGVHYFEPGAECIFNVDGFLVVSEGDVIFAELLGDIRHLKVESGGAGVAVDGGGDAIKGLVEPVVFFLGRGDIS